MNLHNAKQGDWLLIKGKSTVHIGRIDRMTSKWVVDECGVRFLKNDGCNPDGRFLTAELITPERAEEIRREHTRKRNILRIESLLKIDSGRLDDLDFDTSSRYAGELDRLREMLIAEVKHD